MSLRFIHTADWQLGAPFGQFDERTRTLLREARLTAIDRIAAAAVARAATHVLVAGDVFDSQTVTDQLLRQTAARLAKHAPLVWHLLPGNHDHVQAGGAWDRLSRIGVPANVILHVKPEPYPLGTNAMLLPAPLLSKSSSRDPSLWMDTAVTPPGAIRIGLAHGSIRGFGSEHQASQQIDPARAASAGLAYLALGDWHGMQSISDRVWYSGTPEPDGYRDNAPGHVLAVDVAPATGTGLAAVHVESMRTAHFAWAERTAVIDQASDWQRLAEDLAGGGPMPATPRDRQVVRLELRGTVTLAERAAIENGLLALEPAYFYLAADMSALHEHAAEGDLDAFGDAGTRAIAERLQAMAAGGDTTARLALRKLMRLDAERGGSLSQPAPAPIAIGVRT